MSHDIPDDPRDHRPVIPLADFDRRLAHKTVTELRAYWQRLQRGRAVPDRADVDPRAIERTLEYAFILERVAAGHARFRIAGMHLSDVMGMEVRGMPLASFFAPSARAELQEVLEQVFAGPEIVELCLTAEEGFGKPPLTARLLLLPLKSDLGDVSRALGCLVAEGQIGRSPRRFAIDTVEVAAVIPGAPTGPRHRRDAPPTPDAAVIDPALTSRCPRRTTRDLATGPGLAEPPAPPPTMPGKIPDAPLTAILPPGDDTPEARRARFRVIT